MSKKEKKKEVFQPDDKFFKTVMEDKINARAYLENFLFKNITDAPTEELLKIETAFFRSAMVAMANKHQALLIFRSYDVIFELDTDYQLNFLFSYLCQVMDRTTKEMRKDLEDIEFINKNKFMSTLEMFKKEGREEGRVEGKEIGEGLTSLKGLFRLLKGLPDTSIQKIANLASLPFALVNEIKNTSTAKDKEKMLQIIHDGFFKDLALSQDDKDEIESLITSFLN